MFQLIEWPFSREQAGFFGGIATTNSASWVGSMAASSRIQGVSVGRGLPKIKIVKLIKNIKSWQHWLCTLYLLLKLELCLHLPIPLVTLDSSIALQIITQSFLNCLVKMAYRKGLQQLFKGRMKTVNTLACSRLIKWTPPAAVKAKKAIGAQQMKSVKTNRAILLAILESFEFQACN